MTEITLGSGHAAYIAGMPKTELPTLADFADAEHCVLEDTTAAHAAPTATLGGLRAKARDLREEIVIHDRLRGRTTSIRLYADSWMDIEVEARGKSPRYSGFDLRFLDPKPRLFRYRPVRLLKVAGVLGCVTAVLSIPALFGLVPAYTVPAAAIAALATLGSLFWSYYQRHEKVLFHTLTGRAPVVRLGAGLGTIHRFHKAARRIGVAINQAASTLHADLAAYLRSEMREHYRLRSDGILTETECTQATGRILDRFDRTA